MNRRPPPPPPGPPFDRDPRTTPPSGRAVTGRPAASRVEPGFSPPAQHGMEGEPLPRIAREPLRTGPSGSSEAATRRRRPPPPPFDEPEDEGRSWLKIAGFGLLGVVALLIVGGIALAMFVPVDLVRDRLIQEVAERTGRELTIKGKTSLSVWPRLAVAMQGVSLSNPPGMADGPMLTMQALEADVQLWPLLAREVAIDRLVLRKPVIDLRVDAQGRRNWRFAELLVPPYDHRRQPLRYAQAGGDLKGLPKELQDFARGAGQARPGTGAPARGGRTRNLDELSLGDVRIEQGTIRYTDEQTGTAESLEQVELALSAQSLAAALEAKGGLVWRGEGLSLAVRLTPLRAALEEKPVQVVVTASGRRLQAAFDGVLVPASEPEADGRLTLKSESIAELTRWLGRPLAAPPSPGAVDIAMRLKVLGQVVTLADSRLDLDGQSVTAALTIDARGQRPHVKGSLRFAELDLDRLQALRPAEAPAQPMAGRPALRGSSAPQSIEDLLKPAPAPGPAAGGKRGQPQVRGDTRRQGWSANPIDVGALGLADADLRIGFGTIKSATFKTGPGQAVLALKNRVGRITLEELALYEGRGRGVVTIDGTGGGAVIGVNVIVDAVSVAPLFKDVGGPDWLAGRARIAVALAAQGASEADLVQTLNGKADIQMGDGQIVGINVAQVLRGVSQGRFSGFDKVATEKTDFSEMAASFQIANGIAQNSDLRLASPLIRVGGAGTINLPQRTIDYTLKPKVVGSLQGQGAGGIQLAGLEVPVRVTGALDKPSIAPDLGGLVKDPAAAAEALKRLDKREIESTVKGLIGGDGDSKQKARDFLNQFIKR